MSKKIQRPSEQFLYLGRHVNKDYFRAFVYNENGEQKLANSYDEFEALMASGIWLAEKPQVSSNRRKHKDDTNS